MKFLHFIDLSFQAQADNQHQSLCGIGLALVLVIVLCGCNSNAGPPPALVVTNVTDLGTIPTNPAILGRDGAYSALFQGYSVWLYGDTFLSSPNAQGFSLISNSWSFTADLNAQAGITGFQERSDSAGDPTMVLVETAEEQAFNAAHNGSPCAEQPCGARWALWPMSIVTDTSNNQALVFYMVVYAQPGSFNFQGHGSSVALWQNFQQLPQRPNFNPPIVVNHPDLMFNENEPNFGTTALISGGTLYVYGCGTPSNGDDKGCRLARMEPGSVQDPSAWTFYAGNEHWSSQIEDAVSVFIGSSIVSVSWNSFLEQYVAVYSPPFSQNVVMRTAPNPEGPWSREVVAFVAMQPVQGNVYDAHAHSEYDLDGGQTIFVTYSRATGTFSSQVRLVSIQLQRP
ncbi:MAG: DUF4185 domain-containing protein [Candidatus Sulfotelmatobacter sp.]